MDMIRSVRKAFAWTIAAAVVAIAMLYGAVVYYMLDDEPTLLLGCMEADARWRAWTCKQVLRFATLTPARVRELNEQAGAAFPASLQDPMEADELLTLFLASGVDINAPDRRAHDWTALHGFASSGDIAATKLILKHGARTDVRDKDGKSPLDVARRAREKFPNDPKYEEMVRLLETAQRTAEAR
jgi:Ankyrin repeats (3 copies)